MRVLTGRGVNELFALGVDMLAQEGQRAESRAGAVIVMPCPVISVYERPTERVLLSARRDANPFFHLYEALWMLEGRNDSQSLDHYVSDFGKRFAQPDGTIHGAYGHRWREAFGYDQLDEIVRRLRTNPDDRQCVLQMWDANPKHGIILGAYGVGDAWVENAEHATGFDDLRGDWKDRPCNTHVYLRVRTDSGSDRKLLDLTVCCRSNDVVWGAYGANAVHFSFLQEYLAGRIGVGVGTMYQLSNNYHGYVDALDRLGDPRLLLEEADPYADGGGVGMPTPIGENWDEWDRDLAEFMTWHDSLWSDGSNITFVAKNLWFHDVAVPVCYANFLRRSGRMREALETTELVLAADWRRACRAWLLRRKGVVL